MQFPGLWRQGGMLPPGALGGPLPGAFGGPPPGAFVGQPPWGGVGGQFRGMEYATSVEARTISADSTKQKIRTWHKAGAAATSMFYEVVSLFCRCCPGNFLMRLDLLRPQQASHRHDHLPDSKHRHRRLFAAGRAGTAAVPRPRRCTFKPSSKF